MLRSRVGQKEPPRLGRTICYGQELARKSHRDSAVRFVTAKRGPERATKTRQYDLLRPRVGQKESPRLGSTICYGQTWARKSHQNSAVRFVTAKSWPERATKTRQYDLLRPNVGQKEPPKLGSTICYGQELARKSHQDSAVRFVTAKRGPERATKTRQYDLLRPRVVTKTRQYDLLRPNVGQKEPPRLGPAGAGGQGQGGQGQAGGAGAGNSWQKIRGQGGKCKAENSWARRKICGQGGEFVGKAENSWARRKIRGQGGKFVSKAENSWARRKIRGQGLQIRGQGNFPPCPRIFRLAHEFSALPTNFPALPTNFPALPTNFISI